MISEKGVGKLEIGIIALVIIVVAAAGIWIATRPPVEEVPVEELPVLEEVKIGIIRPLTGGYAIPGEKSFRADKLAIKHINEAGGIESLGGAKLTYVFEDSLSTPEGARLAGTRMIEEHKVTLIRGAWASKNTLALADVTEGKAVVITDSISNTITAQGFKYIFRAIATAKDHGYLAVDAVLAIQEKMDPDNPIETAVILHEDSVFGRYGAIGVAERLADVGIDVLYIEEYYYAIEDVSAIVAKVHEAKPDVVFHTPYFPDAALFATHIAEVGPGTRFWAGTGECGWNDPKQIEDLGPVVNYFANTSSWDPTKDTYWNRKFKEDFLAEYGYEPAATEAYAYYTTWVLKEGLELAGKLFPEDPLNPHNLREAFSQLRITEGPAVETYPGVDPVIAFDYKGDPIDPRVVYQQVIDEKIYTVYPVAERDPVYPRPDYVG
jgi:branched-chain amino acid transport system substrate-binding protein